MTRDFTAGAIAKARAEHDEHQRQARIQEIREQGKPAARTVMTTAEAELLVRAHDYDEGEPIGRLALVGLTSDSSQLLVHRGGQVIAEARYDRVLLPKDPRVGSSGTGWTAKSDRKITKYDQA